VTSSPTGASVRRDADRCGRLCREDLVQLWTHSEKRRGIAVELWGDRAEADAEQLVGLLFMAAEPLKRSEITETLRISPARLARACGVLQADPPRGLRLLDGGDRLTLVSAPACAANVERYLGKGPEEALSQAALEVLAIVAYEQPVTRTDIRDIRGVDSGGPLETLIARKLVQEIRASAGEGDRHSWSPPSCSREGSG
jgi:segregation and condensation protein B